MCNRFIMVMVLIFSVTPWVHGATDLNPVAVKQAAAHAPIVLAKDNKPMITLCVMGNNTQRSHKLAIEELRSVYREIFGCDLPVLINKLPDDGQAALVIGDCEASRAAGIDASQLPVEGFVIKTTPNRIFIVGHDDARLQSHSSAWGVYEFIERVLDVRWYWPAVEGGRTLSERATQSVEPMWIEDSPVFRKREIWPALNSGLLNLHTALRSGNSWPQRLVVHAPHKWGKVFGETRPEIFQLNDNGQRDHITLCYGNPRTLETYLEVIDKHVKGQPQSKEESQIILGKTITVSPWDINVTCRCDDCRKLWDADAGQYASASRIMEHFVRALATQVKKRWPDHVVLYLPYLNYTLAATDQKFPDNVEVQLCGMPGVALYKEPLVWDTFQGNIDRWNSLTARKTQTWDYSCWPLSSTRAPYQYPHVLKKYYQHNRETIVGTFINGEKDHWPRSSFSLYCWLKLLWNPEFDVDAAADEACARLFGNAARPMRELWRLQATRWEDSRFPGGTLAAEEVYREAFPKPIVDTMRGLIQEAKVLASDDAAVQHRIDYYTQSFDAFYREYEFVVEGKGMVTLNMKKASQLPVIDGKLDEQAWQTAQPVVLKLYDAKTQASKAAKFPTQLRAMWVPGKGVLFGFRMTEPSPQTLQGDNQGRDDGGLWHQDCVELFIDPSGQNSGNFYQFILTAGGSVFDSKDGDPNWNCEGLQFAHHLGDGFWSMEIFIPAQSMNVEFDTTAAAGRVWFGQFTRHRISDRQGGTENQKMNANQAGFNSNTGDFGKLIFIE